ncbi:hypothetical protein [Collimonas silvisoli]|uniref:hypothetical protein n=1 Tax=Collimonas silvisoli TaxID=2825884 RepID=UPI001B8C9CCF|nr:hypothetical protein [Collimonas silvisoli]
MTIEISHDNTIHRDADHTAEAAVAVVKTATGLQRPLPGRAIARRFDKEQQLTGVAQPVHLHMLGSHLIVKHKIFIAIDLYRVFIKNEEAVAEIALYEARIPIFRAVHFLSITLVLKFQKTAGFIRLLNDTTDVLIERSRHILRVAAHLLQLSLRFAGFVI